VKKWPLLLCSVIIVCGLSRCEFKKPSNPRYLPSRWNAKVIIPFMDETYSFSDLLTDTTAISTTSIFADSTNDTLKFLINDSLNAPVTMNDSLFFIKNDSVVLNIDLGQDLKIRKDSSFKLISKNIFVNIDSSNNHIFYGILSNVVAYNKIKVSAQLSDTFSTNIKLKVQCNNFWNNSEPMIDSMLINLDTTLSEMEIDIAGDSLVNIKTGEYLDSLKFSLILEPLDTLRSSLDSIVQNLEIKIHVSSLELSSFFGNGFASKIQSTNVIDKSPGGALGIVFDSTMIKFDSLIFSGDMAGLRLNVMGMNLGTDNISVDSLFSSVNGGITMDISDVLGILPDSIRIIATGYLGRQLFESSQSFTGQITLGHYQITTPLSFLLPAEIKLASANHTRFFIEDSVTRSNLAKTQNGAEIDLLIENRTPFQGKIYLLAGNFPLPIIDTAEIAQDQDYLWNNARDSLFYVAGDTELVRIDTVAMAEIKAAQFDEYNALTSPGITEQMYVADSSAIAHFADSTVYFMPLFYLMNPETLHTVITGDQEISIKGYLGLLFNPSSLGNEESEPDSI